MLGKSSKKKFNAGLWRDHSANQRTYLSWMRSAIAVMGFGWAILRVQTPPDQLFNVGWLTGFLLSIMGIVMVMTSTRHYFRTRRAIDTGSYEPARVRIISFTVLVLLLGVGILYFLITDPELGIVEYMYFDQLD
jgi:putative membrane protein